MAGAQHFYLQSNDLEQNRQKVYNKTVSMPGDIWGCIAQFMSQEDLCRMIGVNSVLFHHAMDARYRTVSLQHFDETNIQKFWRLRDPVIVPRVRHLHINPIYVHELLTLDSKEPGNDTRYKAFPQGIIQLMAETISALSNVSHFSIDWVALLDPEDGPSPEDLRPFFTAAWKTLGSGLHRIVLRVGLEYYPVLLPSAGMLPTLQELELHLYHLPSIDHGNVLVTAVAPFINVVAPTLQVLSLSSSSSMFKGPSVFNYSLLFSSVGNIPNLKKLDVRMEFYMCGLSDPHGMTRILRDHVSTLRHVKWTPVLNTWDTEATLIPWMEENKDDRAILTNLLTLAFFIPLNPRFFDLALGYINRSADTLMSLSLFGSYLSHDEVKAVLAIFGHRQAEQSLEELLLRVKLLSPELVLMVARMLPSLHKLTVHVESVAEALRKWNEPKDEAGEITQAPDFPGELRNRDIRSWNLHDFDLIASRLTTGVVDTDKLMHLFAECVPSIKRVSGRDKESFKADRLRSLAIHEGAM